MAASGAIAGAGEAGAPAQRPIFGQEAQLAEFRHVERRLREIDFAGPPAKTSGRDNVAAAEWPFFALAYFGYAGCNLAERYPERHAEMMPKVRWALAMIQTRRISGFVAPHFGEPFGKEIKTPSVLVHGHFLFLAMRYRKMSGDKGFDDLIRRVADVLREAYEHEAQAILPSYPEMWYPTDNLPALAGLERYAETFGAPETTAPKRWVQSMKEHYLDPSTGLMCSYADPVRKRPLSPPRGIALMFAVPFLQVVDEEFAADQYARAKRYLVKEAMGLAAVREFVKGQEGQADVDSGPVIFGLGQSASGFALGAAGAMKDSSLLAALERSAVIVGNPSWHGNELVFEGMPVVGQAVLLAGKTSPAASPAGKQSEHAMESLLRPAH
jgi:hypothetical protein